MKCFMTEQEKCVLLIQVTAWASLTVFFFKATDYLCLGMCEVCL